MKRKLTLISVALTTTLIAGCSSSGGKTEETGGADGGAKAKTMTVSFITHQAPGDTFWDLVRKGAETAAENDGVTLEYTNDPDGANQANLVKTAMDKKVDGIAVTLAKPDAMKANVMAARKAGIPVVALNGGITDYKAMNVLGYFGQDEGIAGQAAGERLKKDGAGKALCVIQEQGHVGLEARCAGAKKTFPQMEKIYVTGTDMANVQSSITSKLQQDSAITHVLTLGAPFAMTAVKSAAAAGGKAKVATFDTNAELVNAIKEDKVAWAVDQQPFLQGYLAVDALYLYKTNGNEIGGGQPVLTGPAFIDKTNVDKVAEYAAAGTR